MALRCKELPASLPTPAQQLRVPDNDDWAQLYPKIEHLYIQKRYKLRHIMQHIERTYGLKASEQMYKKRLAQWDLQKNPRRPIPCNSGPESYQLKRKKAVKTDTCYRKNVVSISPSPRFPKQDRLTLLMLKSVERCSTSYFEACDTATALTTRGAHPEVVIDFIFALKLVNNLLENGHGHLAGRLTRKAFLMLENIITLDSPALIWNLLEITHQMITLRHIRLCKMLLTHLCVLAERKLTSLHPLSTMLRTMNEILTMTEATYCQTQGSSPSSTPSYSSICSSPSSESSNADNPPSILLDLWRQSWVVNAEIIFGHLDIGFFGMYCNIDWDSCSLVLPTNELQAASQWFNQMETQWEHDVAPVSNEGESLPVDIDSGSAEALLAQPTLFTKENLAETFGKLRHDSIAALKRDWQTIAHAQHDVSNDNTILIRVLAALVSANVLEWPAIAASSDTTYIETSEISRMHASHIASALRILLDLKHDGRSQGDVDKPDVIASIRATIALTEYAYGETDPRVVRELWSLQAAFSIAGDRDKARQTEADALDRLEQYVCDIPHWGV